MTGVGLGWRWREVLTVLAKVVMDLAVGVLELTCTDGFVVELELECTLVLLVLLDVETVVLVVVDVDCCVDFAGLLETFCAVTLALVECVLVFTFSGLGAVAKHVDIGAVETVFVFSEEALETVLSLFPVLSVAAFLFLVCPAVLLSCIFLDFFSGVDFETSGDFFSTFLLSLTLL